MSQSKSWYVLWLPVFVTAVMYWRLRPILPDQFAVHFNTRLEPDLWLPATLAVGVLAHLLIAMTLFATVACVRSGSLRRVAASFLWISGVCAATLQMLRFNAHGASPEMWPTLVLFGAALLVSVFPQSTERSQHAD